MIDKIKATLTNSYLHLLYEFADPSSFEKNKVIAEVGELKDLFNTQRAVDKLKKRLSKPDFDKVLCAYFGQFQSSDGIDFRSLGEALTKNHKVFLRHLGKDKLSYLNLLVSISQCFEQKKKGLLGAA